MWKGGRRSRQVPCADEQQTRSRVVSEGHRGSGCGSVVFAQSFISAVLRVDPTALSWLKFYSSSSEMARDCKAVPAATLTLAGTDKT